MRITYDYDEFFDRTGIIFERQRIKALGFSNNDSTATFWIDNLDELIHFCENNPQYHIVTSIRPGVFVNRLEETDENIYQLADGDQDPHYMLDVSQQQEWIVAEIYEYIHSLGFDLKIGKRRF